MDHDLWPFFYLIIEGNQAAFCGECIKGPTQEARPCNGIDLDLDLWPFFYLIIEGNQAAFCGECIKGPTQEAPLCFRRPCGATVTRLTPNQKVVCLNHVGVRRYLLDIKRLMSNMGNVPSVA